MRIEIAPRDGRGGTEFLPEPSRLHLGGQQAEGVDKLEFSIPAEWNGKDVSLYIEHADGTQQTPVQLDEENTAPVDRKITSSTSGRWMLVATDGRGYTAYTKPGTYDVYGTLATDGAGEDPSPSLYEQFVARVLESANIAQASAKSAGQSSTEAAASAQSATASAQSAAGSASRASGSAAAAAESEAAAKASADRAAASEPAGAADRAEAAANRAEAAQSAAAASAESVAGAEAATAGDAAKAEAAANRAEAAQSAAAGSASRASGSAAAAAESEAAAKASADRAAASEPAGAADRAEAAANRAEAAQSAAAASAQQAGDAAASLDVEAIKAALTPPGAVQYFAMEAPPAGWLVCNGAAVSRAGYAALFGAIGTTFGEGDGSSTFSIPNLHGYIIEGNRLTVGKADTFLAGQGSRITRTLTLLPCIKY